MRKAFRSAHDVFVESKSLSNGAKVFIAVSATLGLASWKVLGNSSDKRGQTLMSQEKPDVLLGPQRDLIAERAKVDALAAHATKS